MTTNYVALDGMFGAKYEDGKITGWWFYPAMDCRAEDMDGNDFGSGLDWDEKATPF